MHFKFMGLAKIYWTIYHRILIICQFIYRKFNFKILSSELKYEIYNNKGKELWIIYDTSISPLAFGEIFDCLMLARALQCKGIKINFFFTKGKIRKDYKKILKSKKSLDKRLLEIFLLSKLLIGEKNVSFRKFKLNQIILKSDKKGVKILFLKSLKKKIPLYQYGHNLCFLIFNFLNKNSKNKFLLNKENFKNKNYKKNFFKNYICIGVRMSLANEKDRNLKISEINKLIKQIRKLYKNLIVIVSDLESYKILKKNKNLIHDKKIKFSKNYFKHFIDDGSIILNSKKYFQYKGTGIQMFAEFSKINFNIFHEYKDYTIFAKILRSDLYFDFKNKIKNNWQNKNQVFLELNNLN